MSGNKGGMCISLSLGISRMLFINCHLPHGDGGTELRSEHLNKLYQKFVLNKLDIKPQKMDCNVVAPQPKEIPYNAIIWLGDFNYRINGAKSFVL